MIGVLITLFLASCSGPAPETSQVTPTAQVVEYGASLSEWEVAVAAEDPNSLQSEYVGDSTVDEGATAQEEAGEVVSSESGAASSSSLSLGPIMTEDGFRVLGWEDLVPEDFTPEAIMEKYQAELSKFQDGDPEAMMLYMQMQTEFNNAPVNASLNDIPIRLPGFIAPLEFADGIITQFLLVPYFGACIHVPPPPVNQTVLVQLAEGQGIKVEDSYNPIWVQGVMTTDGTTTDLADAGYFIDEAVAEPYSYEN